MELLGKWKPMDVEDSLELLSSHYTNPTVRRYAVARLRQADDEVHHYPWLLGALSGEPDADSECACMCVREGTGWRLLEGKRMY